VSQIATEIIRQDGVRGLFGRGLATKIGINGLQSAVFTIAWKLGQDLLNERPPPPTTATNGRLQGQRNTGGGTSASMPQIGLARLCVRQPCCLHLGQTHLCGWLPRYRVDPQDVLNSMPTHVYGCRQPWLSADTARASLMLLSLSGNGRMCVSALG
jgi:hypothetical protein